MPSVGVGKQDLTSSIADHFRLCVRACVCIPLFSSPFHHKIISEINSKCVRQRLFSYFLVLSMQNGEYLQVQWGGRRQRKRLPDNHCVLR